MVEAPGRRIDFRLNQALDLDAVIDLYRASTLGQRRPIEDRECMARMIEAADLVLTAWDGDRLVGIARTLTDTCYVAYLADLAVDHAYQRRGIGRELIRRTRAELGHEAIVVLLAAPDAEDYYPKIGFEHHPQAWVLRPGHEIH